MVSPLAGKIYDKSGLGALLPTGFACIAIFPVILSLFIGVGNILLVAILYIPIICGCALVIGLVQSFALSRLSWKLNSHGTTVMSAGFQVAGALGSSLFTGIYYLSLSESAVDGVSFMDAGTNAFLVVGITGACFAVVAIVLALVESRLSRRQVAAPATVQASQSGGGVAGGASATAIPTLADIMKSDVYALSQSAQISDVLEMFVGYGISGVPVVDEDDKAVGFISDG